MIDGSSFIFRAYYQSIRQDQKYNYRTDRLPTGAVRLFCAKLLQFIQEGAAGLVPTHLALIFDQSEQSFRKELYPDYKAKRQEPPEDLVWQFPLMRQAAQAFGLIPIEQERYEADDLIATYARTAQEKGADVLIISADKDLMQLIGPSVNMYDPASGTREERWIDAQGVEDHFGVPPEQVVDVQALAGDSSDNVPGAPGIGLKTAAQLIQEYGSLENLLQHAHEISQPKRRESLTLPENVARIRLSKELVRLREDVPVRIPLGETRLLPPDPTPLIAFLKAMEFSALTRRVADLYGADLTAIAPDSELLGAKGWRQRNGTPLPEEKHPPSSPLPSLQLSQTPAHLAKAKAEQMRAIPLEYHAYETVLKMDRLEEILAHIQEKGYCAVDTETDSLDPIKATLVGISLAFEPGQACYIPLAHVSSLGIGELFGGPVLRPEQLPLSEVLACLKSLLEDESILKIGQNIKYDMLVFENYGIDIRSYDDTMLMSYVLDAGRHAHGMDELSAIHLGHTPLSFKEVAGTGKNFKGFAAVELDRATAYAAEDADITLRLWHIFQQRLAGEKMVRVYETLERPLVRVLARLERRGIKVDRSILAHLSQAFSQEMAKGEENIHNLAGEAFNLASTKQVSDILFGKMGLKGGKKTATGAWSTSASVLEDLAQEGVELAARLLDWRQLSKLKSTYTDALPTHINPHTGRVHTSYSSAATTTGRLASSTPNLQNIPVKNALGRMIRSAFCAREGFQLVCADYSQIELRLLAHMADIPALKAAFAKGVDIHALTASEMFHIPLDQMTPEIRRRAKAINFGIIYGISAFGLANQLGISREEAGAAIKRYFERFPQIQAYIEKTKAECRKKGYVTTLFGRRCHYPRISSTNPAERAFNERAAINAPLQGTAADIIRRAMVHMEPAIEEARLNAHMLLQVHDELVFEIADEDVARALPLLQKIMQEACLPALDLRVPLVVAVQAARNWDEAH